MQIYEAYSFTAPQRRELYHLGYEAQNLLENIFKNRGQQTLARR